VDALQISVVRTKRAKGSEEITHVGTSVNAGTRWFTLHEVIEAIEQGGRFYVQTGAESTLSVGFDAGYEQVFIGPILVTVSDSPAAGAPPYA